MRAGLSCVVVFIGGVVTLFVLVAGISWIVNRWFGQPGIAALSFYTLWSVIGAGVVLWRPRLDYGLLRLGRWRSEALAIFLILLAWLAPNVLPRFFVQGSWKLPEFSLFLVISVAVAPVVEEFLFRGLLQRYFDLLCPYRWLPRLPLTAAIVLSALLFSLWHFPNPIRWVASLNSLKPYLHLAGGLTLGILRERTGSIWPGVVIHALGNLSAWF
jgi:membrane protease YdiL (CAAX protease family)